MNMLKMITLLHYINCDASVTTHTQTVIYVEVGARHKKTSVFSEKNHAVEKNP